MATIKINGKDVQVSAEVAAGWNQREAEIAAKSAGGAGRAADFAGLAKENIIASMEGSILTMKIDLSKRLRPSSTGKSTVVATTSGNKTVTLPDGATVYIGVNAYAK